MAEYRCPCCHQPLEDSEARIIDTGGSSIEFILECNPCPSYGRWQFVGKTLLFDRAWLKRYWEEVPAYDPVEHALR